MAIGIGFSLEDGPMLPFIFCTADAHVPVDNVLYDDLVHVPHTACQVTHVVLISHPVSPAIRGGSARDVEDDSKRLEPQKWVPHVIEVVKPQRHERHLELVWACANGNVSNAEPQTSVHVIQAIGMKE